MILMLGISIFSYFFIIRVAVNYFGPEQFTEQLNYELLHSQLEPEYENIDLNWYSRDLVTGWAVAWDNNYNELDPV